MRHISPSRTATLAVILHILLLPAFLSAAAHAWAPLTIDADSQFRYARSRLDSGAFDEAVSEFNRFIHFFPKDPRIPWARYLIGVAHFKAGRYQKAEAIFVGIAGEDERPDLQSEAFIMLSRSHARRGMLEQAMVDLHNLIAVSTQPAVIDRARYELGWLHVASGQWPVAERAFDRIGPDNRQRYQIDELIDAVSRYDGIPTKDPVTAGLLSIIPGGGQLYCGRYQDALTAFLLNAGLILSAWEAFDNELYALGGVISFVEFGFYSGNIYGAVSSAHKFNRDRVDEFRRDLYRRKQTPVFLSTGASGVALCLRVDF